VWKKCLSKAEILQGRARNYVPDDLGSLLACWTFSEGKGSSVRDLSANNILCKATGGSWTTCWSASGAKVSEWLCDSGVTPKPNVGAERCVSQLEKYTFPKDKFECFRSPFRARAILGSAAFLVRPKQDDIRPSSAVVALLAHLDRLAVAYETACSADRSSHAASVRQCATELNVTVSVDDLKTALHVEQALPAMAVSPSLAVFMLLQSLLSQLHTEFLEPFYAQAAPSDAHSVPLTASSTMGTEPGGPAAGYHHRSMPSLAGDGSGDAALPSDPALGDDVECNDDTEEDLTALDDPRRVLLGGCAALSCLRILTANLRAVKRLGIEYVDHPLHAVC